jgi:hypothetical protein
VVRAPEPRLVLDCRQLQRHLRLSSSRRLDHGPAAELRPTLSGLRTRGGRFRQTGGPAAVGRRRRRQRCRVGGRAAAHRLFLMPPWEARRLALRVGLSVGTPQRLFHSLQRRCAQRPTVKGGWVVQVRLGGAGLRQRLRTCHPSSSSRARTGGG